MPSLMTLRAYEDHPSQPQGIFQDVPLELIGNTILIDIEVVDAQVGYNIILGHIDMYSMKGIASNNFYFMISPHEGEIVTIDQLTYYDTKPSSALNNVFPVVEGSLSMPSFTKVGPMLYTNPLMISSLFYPPPHNLSKDTSLLCTVTNGASYSTPSKNIPCTS